MTGELPRLLENGLNMQLDHRVICQFRFICNELWENLIPVIDDPKRRFCSVCNSHVHLTNSYEELEKNIAAKKCVAILLKNPDIPPLEIMGYVIPSTQDENTVAANLLHIRPLDELELSAVLLNLLKNNNVHIVRELLICTENKLVEEFGITKEQMNEISEIITYREWKLGMNF